MKPQDLVNIFKKYLNEDVRLIIREEIKIAFKELAREQISENKTKITPIANKQIIKKPLQQPISRAPIKPIVRTGNTTLDNILIETHRNMIAGGDTEPMVDEREIQALLTKGIIPQNDTISMTTKNVPIPRKSNDYMEEYAEELDIISSLETIDPGQIPSVDDFINMKR